MKTYIYIVSLLLFACAKEKPQNLYDTEVVILIDHTDPLKIQPNADEIYNFLKLDQNLRQGVKITIGEVSDMDINKSKVVLLPNESEWMGNKTVREMEIRKFRGELREALKDAGN